MGGSILTKRQPADSTGNAPESEPPTTTGTDAFEPDLTLLDPWRPAEAARRLAGVRAPWYVAAGWAIDLYLGGGTREHEDLEIAVPHDRFGEVAEALSSYEFCVPVGENRLRPLDAAGELLETHHQTWLRERNTGRWRLDVFREPSRDGMWVCRRDERLTLPYDEVIARTDEGIPYARPEIALLFKAKHHRPRDQADLAAVLPHLERERRRWLAGWLERIHPGHAWIETLAEAEPAPSEWTESIHPQRNP